MNKILIFLFVASLNAFAQGPTLNCNNGTIEEMGDSLFSLELSESELNVQPYESGFSIPWNKLTTSLMPDGSKLIYTTDFEVTFSSEGDEYVKWLNVLILKINKAQSEATLTYTFNGEDLVAQNLKCSK
jgi:hypothetical protein